MATPALQVGDVNIILSSYEGVKVKVVNGEVELSLNRFSGNITFSQIEASGKRKTGERTGLSTPETPRQTSRPIAQDNETATSATSALNELSPKRLRMSPAPSPPSEEFLALYSHLQSLPKEALKVSFSEQNEKGVFNFLGNGKNPVKNNAVEVVCSNYDPTKKKPEDLVAGRKGGQGVFAKPDRAGVAFFEFALADGLELQLESYLLRNGSRDLGTYLKQWVMERERSEAEGGGWEIVDEQRGSEALDGCRQAPQHFALTKPCGPGRRFRLRRTGSDDTERHPLWLCSVELFGTLCLTR